MSKAMQAVSLNILGKEYKIACAEDEQQSLINSAQALDKQMRKIRDTGKVNGADKIAVLAALNLVHDLNSAAPKNVTIEEGVAARLKKLRLKIENVLENP